MIPLNIFQFLYAFSASFQTIITNVYNYNCVIAPIEFLTISYNAHNISIKLVYVFDYFGQSPSIKWLYRINYKSIGYCESTEICIWAGTLSALRKASVTGCRNKFDFFIISESRHRWQRRGRGRDEIEKLKRDQALEVACHENDSSEVGARPIDPARY